MGKNMKAYIALLLSLAILLCSCSKDTNLENQFIGTYELTRVVLDSGEVPKSMLPSVDFVSFTLESSGLCHWSIGNEWTGEEVYTYDWEKKGYGVCINDDTVLTYDEERKAFFEQVNGVDGIKQYVYELQE